MKHTIFHSIIALLLLSSCGNGRTGSFPQEDGDTLHFQYAEMLTVVRHEGYTAVTIKDPWKKGHLLHTYLLVPRGKKIPSHLPSGTLVRIPIERSVVFTAAHCQLLYDLGAQNAITGVCDLKYIHIPDLQKRVGKDTPPSTFHLPPVVDCGDGMAPMVEKIIDLRPQALLLSPFENSGGYGRLEEIEVPIVECADYMETSALGRAEWMRFYGMLFGKEKEADSLFHQVDSAYHALSMLAKRQPKERSMITERLTGSTWYVAGGRSSVGRLIADANGIYVWADDTHSGSLAFPFEYVLEKAGDADVWVFNHSGSKPLTYKILGAEYHGYSIMKAFRERNVWYVNTMQVPYFEEVSFHPDYLLRDYIILLHPHLTTLGALRYYKKVKG